MYSNVTGEISRQEIGISLTSNQAAKIEGLELMGTAVQEAAFDYELVKKEDGSYGIAIELKDGSGLKAGSSQTLKFKVKWRRHGGEHENIFNIPDNREAGVEREHRSYSAKGNADDYRRGPGCITR